MKELSTIISEVSFAFNCSVLEPNIIVLEQLLHEFPWYNILDALWEHQPKYSSELYSNSTVGGSKIVSDYDQIINTPNLPALDLLPTPDAKDSGEDGQFESIPDVHDGNRDEVQLISPKEVHYSHFHRKMQFFHPIYYQSLSFHSLPPHSIHLPH